jgi:hypothetical protein
LIVLLILQIVLGALAFVAIKNDDGELNKQVTTAVKRVFDDYVKHNTNEDKQKVIDGIQKDFECCGVNSPAYWATNGIQVLDPPKSCYEDGERQISKKFTVGCADKFIDVITSNIKVIGGVAIGFAVVEVSTFV